MNFVNSSDVLLNYPKRNSMSKLGWNISEIIISDKMDCSRLTWKPWKLFSATKPFDYPFIHRSWANEIKTGAT